MIFWRSRKIFKTQLVLNGEDHNPVGLEHRSRFSEHDLRRIIGVIVQGRVLQHPDQRDHVKLLWWLKL